MVYPIGVVTAGKPLTDYVEALIAEPEDALAKAAKELTDTEFTQLGMWTENKITGVGVQATLWTGGLLYGYQLATEKEGRQSFFKTLIQSLEIKKTKAYGSIRIFRKFGKPLYEQRELMSRMSTEALTILARDETPSAAPQEAFELARQGERITIKLANKLCKKYAAEAKDVELDHSAEPQPLAEKADKLTLTAAAKATAIHEWSFVGKLVRVTVDVPEPCDISALPSILQDLEDAKASLRAEYGASLDHPDAA